MTDQHSDDELRALAWLRKNGVSWLHELPPFISVDTMRALDTDGLIEVLPWAFTGGVEWRPLPRPGWVSPVANLAMIGNWERVWSRYTDEPRLRQERLQVRLTDKGHVEAQRTKPDGGRATEKWLAPALVLLNQKPTPSNREIAKEVGVSHTTLSRNKTFRRARSIAQDHEPLSGFKSSDGTLDAFDDNFDPNRPASRQSNDEEDFDKSLD